MVKRIVLFNIFVIDSFSLVYAEVMPGNKNITNDILKYNAKLRKVKIVVHGKWMYRRSEDLSNKYPYNRAERDIKLIYPKEGKFQRIDVAHVTYGRDVKKCDMNWKFYSIAHDGTTYKGFKFPDDNTLDKLTYDGLKNIPGKIFHKTSLGIYNDFMKAL